MKLAPKFLSNDDLPLLESFYHVDSKEKGFVFNLVRKPDFFEALDIHGKENLIPAIVDSDSGKLVCACIRSIKNCYVNQIPSKLGYFSSLKVGKEYRNTVAFARLFKFFRSISGQEPCKAYLASVFEDNETAKKILESQKADIMHFKDMGLYQTFIFKKCKSKNHHPSIALRRAEKSDISAIVNFINNEGKKKQFFPVYEEADFNSKNGLLKNLKDEDIFLALKNDELVGIAAIWDQLKFRQWEIKSYPLKWLFLRPFINMMCNLTGRPTFPKAGKPLPLKYISLLCIKDDNINVFEALLSVISNYNKNGYLSLGLHEADPLIKGVTFPHFSLKNRIYLAYWKENFDYISAIEKTILYLEGGSL